MIASATVCPRSLDPFYKVSYYKKQVKTSWTYSIPILQIEDDLLQNNCKIKPRVLFENKKFLSHKYVSVFTGTGIYCMTQKHIHF